MYMRILRNVVAAPKSINKSIISSSYYDIMVLAIGSYMAVVLNRIHVECSTSLGECPSEM